MVSFKSAKWHGDGNETCSVCGSISQEVWTFPMYCSSINVQSRTPCNDDPGYRAARGTRVTVSGPGLRYLSTLDCVGQARLGWLPEEPRRSSRLRSRPDNNRMNINHSPDKKHWFSRPVNPFRTILVWSAFYYFPSSKHFLSYWQ